MDVVELSMAEGLKKIATWDPTYGINMTRALSEVYTQISQSLQNRTMIVTSRIGMPYLQYKYMCGSLNFSILLFEFNF